MTSWNALNRHIIQCEQCPRLRAHCAEIARVRRRAYREWEYWGKPVPNFGEPQARLLIVGLAPAAHGANRTGRMFSGDRSGEWLYRALHRAGFANQALAVSRDDGLRLQDCVITAVCHCAPPTNKPTRQELQNCQPWLAQTFDLVPARIFLALGQIAWKETWAEIESRGWNTVRRPKFGHGQTQPLTENRWLIASYHPSQQNTFTGRLTEPMLDDVFRTANQLLKREAP
jgi:uracil-DNA glycosylase family 4